MPQIRALIGLVVEGVVNNWTLKSRSKIILIYCIVWQEEEGYKQLRKKSYTNGDMRKVMTFTTPSMWHGLKSIILNPCHQIVIHLNSL